MITGFDIYLMTRLDSIIGLSLGISIVGWIGILITGIIAAVNHDFGDDITLMKKILKISTPIVLFFTLLALFVPSSKEAAAIYLIPKIANNEQVQQLPENAMKVLNLKLQEWIKGMETK